MLIPLHPIASPFLLCLATCINSLICIITAVYNVIQQTPIIQWIQCWEEKWTMDIDSSCHKSFRTLVHVAQRVCCFKDSKGLFRDWQMWTCAKISSKAVKNSQRWSKQFCKANDFSLSQLVGMSTSWLFTRINNTPPRVNSLLKSRPFLDLGIQIASPNFKYLALFGIELQGYAILFPNYPNSNIITIIIILVKSMEKSSLPWAAGSRNSSKAAREPVSKGVAVTLPRCGQAMWL